MEARPLARIIDNEIKKPISKEMLFGKLVSGGKVLVSIQDGELTFDIQSFADMMETPIESTTH